ncbi:coiled-coil domain-containing protein [Mycoplasma crocodyli]|uniref:coiled-coil domain-containing protein n=1 Tax=Mycoplasma crocodyli TaxID=50052 RepID=UPI00031A407D|nr:hypothetical protein [Mycoplasma crocodyli]
MKNKKLIILSSLTLSSILPISLVSCVNNSNNNKQGGNEWSIPSDKPGTGNEEIKPDVIKTKTVNDYFKNVKVKSDKYKSALEWLNALNKELSNDPKAKFTFNRFSKDDAIDAKTYLQSSSVKMSSVISKDFISNDNKYFSQSLAYNIIAKIDDKNTNKLLITIALYNPLTDNDKVSELNLEHVFESVSLVKKAYEDLVPVTQEVKVYLANNIAYKTIESTKVKYSALEAKIAEAQVLIDKKSEVKTDVEASKLALKAAKDELKNVIDKYQETNKFAQLTNLVASVKSQYVEYEKDATIPEVSVKLTTLKANVTEADNFIKANVFDQTKNNDLVKKLNDSKKELDDLIATLETKLNEFATNFSSKVEITSNNLNLPPSGVPVSSFKVKDANNLAGSISTFKLKVNNAYGRVLISTTVKYGKLTKEIEEFIFDKKFKTNDFVNKWYAKNIFGDLDTIKNTKFNNATKEFNDIKLLSEKLLALKNVVKTDDNKIVLEDNVALLIAAQLWSKETTKTADEIIAKTKTEFIDIKTSKLDFIQNSSRWYDFRKLIRMTIYANNNTTGKTEVALATLRDQKFTTFANDWFKDLIEKYFNKDTKADPGKWALFEYYAPYKVMEILYLLDAQLDETTRTKAIESLNHFASSISKYGQMEGSLNTTLKGKYIDKNLYAQNSFIVRNYVNLLNQDLVKAEQDSKDYVDWLNNLDYSKEFNSSNKYLQGDLNKLRLFTNFFIELSKNENGSDLGIYNKVKLDKFYTWATETYIKTDVTFAKLNEAKGEELMKNIGIIYRILAINPTLSSGFVNILKEGLLKGKAETDLTNLEKINWDFIKNDWKNVFLSK